MIDSSVEIFVPTTTKTSDGVFKKTFGYEGFGGGNWNDTLIWADTAIWYDGATEIITADVQPKSLSVVEMSQWGIKNLSNDAKAIYNFDDPTYLVYGNRARVDGTDIYDIRARNDWPCHTEIIFLPVMGITYTS